MDNYTLFFIAIAGVIVIVGVIFFIRRRRRSAANLVTPVVMSTSPVEEESPVETTMTNTPAGEMLPQMHARLIGLEGPMAGREFEIALSREGLTLGRDQTNDVAVVSDMQVSRQHAQIICEKGQYVLYDRDSANGVFVNERRVGRHELRTGDVVRISNTTTFRFAQSGGAPAVALITPHTRSDAPNSMFLGSDVAFEGYHLEREIGRGGMSVVYKASNAQRRPFAIKVLDVDEPYIVRKFIQEGQIGAMLGQHPNICKVFKSGQTQDGRFYIVMEYIEGCSLRQYVGQMLPDTQVVSMIGQACDALHYAHLQNVVHRDIKPENIMMDRQGVVKVTDFGIAKLMSSATVTKDAVGTPEYISPEQVRGERVTPSSDVYALGVVLYELLVGQPPFPRPPDMPPRNAALVVFREHLQTPPLSPSRSNPGISRGLEQVTLRALEKEPQRRFGSAWEMAEALGYRRVTTTPLPGVVTAQLVVMQGAHVGQTIAIKGERLTLGRTDIGAEDIYISGQHFSISRRGAQLWLQDLSRNGTWVNGQRVFGEVALRSGDVIAVGYHVLRIEYLS